MSDHILDLLRCVVCLEYFSSEDIEKSPRLLDCSHSFCLSCCRDIASTYSRTHISIHNDDYCLPCPVCRQMTYLNENGVLGLRQNLTAIGLLDVPIMLNVSTKPLLKENIRSLQDDMLAQMNNIQNNIKEIEKAVMNVNTKETSEINIIHNEFEWINKLLTERRTALIHELQLGFQVRKNILATKLQDLYRIQNELQVAIDTSTLMIQNDEHIHPQNLVDKKQSMRRLLRESTPNIHISSVMTCSKMRISFEYSFFHRLAFTTLIFGHIHDTNELTSITNHIVSSSLEYVSNCMDVKLDSILSLLVPMTKQILITYTFSKQLLQRGMYHFIQGLSFLSGLNTETIYSASSYCIDTTKYLIRSYLYTPIMHFTRVTLARIEIAILIKLSDLLGDNNSILYHDNVFSDCIIASIGKICRYYNITASRVRALGVDVELLCKMGFSAKSLRDAGFDEVLLLKDLGYSAVDLVDAGYGLNDLTTAGYAYVDIILAHGFANA